MTQDPGTATWRYTWLLPVLPNPGVITAEYRATDALGASGVVKETINVSALEDKADVLLDVSLGRQRLAAGLNRWTLYRRNGTVLIEFLTKDDTGTPNGVDVFERVPLP
jgi:hypothetical protein